MDPLLQVKNISKNLYSTGMEKLMVLESVNFSVSSTGEGKILSVLGPFGSGKTTLFKIISALIKPSEGEILLDGKPYKNPSGEIAYLPEKPSDFPWLNARENIKLISQIRHVNLTDEKIGKIISLVGLTGYENHIPHSKSAGFRFRAALGRALAADPKIILLDDVFKIMDTETKNELYVVLRDIKNELSPTFLLASGNVTEAILLSDHIYLMHQKPGKIIGEIGQEKLNQIAQNLKTEEFTTIRKEIESAYQIENFSSSINISI